MNKFKRGDTILYGRNLLGTVVVPYKDNNHYIIETSSGLLYNVPEEDLKMYKIPRIINNSLYGATTIKKVTFSDMATIVIWGDGTKTIVRKHEDDVYDPEKAIAMCFMKKICQKNKLSMNEIFET